MKTSIIPFFQLALLLMACLFSMNMAQAQQAEKFLASTDSHLFHEPDEREEGEKNTPPETYHFDINAGQHPAHFEGLEKYMADHVFYPENAKENCAEGTVKIIAVISPKGKIMEASVVESLNKSCDRAALEAVRQMPDWAPAMNYGIPVKGKAMIEIAFRLQ